MKAAVPTTAPKAPSPPEPAEKSRRSKLATALGGDNEFSVQSVDPRARKVKVSLPQADVGAPAATGDQDDGLLWRALRKIF